MNFDFITTKNINDYLPAIKDRPEFIIAEKEWYNVINYVVVTPNTFENPNEEGISEQERNFRILRKDCRGLKFDQNGDILAKPYHKFHNVNERPDTQINVIDWKQPHMFLEKLDGSMVHPLFSKKRNGFRFATKMGITDTSMLAEEFVAANPKYFTFARAMHEMGYTTLFEWESPRSMIVIRYETENLILTGLRNTFTGKYASYETMERIGAQYDIPVVKFIYTSDNVENFIEKMSTMTGIEGWVVRFFDGQMVKIKVPDYVLKHNSKDLVSSDRRVYELVLNGEIDDIKPVLESEDFLRVIRLEVDLNRRVRDLADRFVDTFKPYKGMDKKQFATEHAPKLDKMFRGAIFGLLDGKQAYDLSFEVFKKHVHQDSKWKSFLEEFQL